ncbi:MAG TPA: fused MFS/spermidine synthase [Verrucomicrobia bacterium]|nr:fused MFS/spermidine synthase [Verrucomicrobiota bacterium]HOB31817.1 fused MFS/spermidine synthase [Verrucomicrobiota bacterium]HOP97585.1 fused MFS/spermidine synthase [Verrucomicrobiota bacterium]
MENRPVRRIAGVGASHRRTRIPRAIAACVLLLLGAAPALPAVVVFDRYSPYHHVQVIETGTLRILSFDGTRETQMSLTNPLEGHFEYTEYFHMPFVWNPEACNVLMIGLGGGSTQRSFLHYHTNTVIDTVELDPVVVEVARTYFGVTESARHRIHLQDGRVFLRRATNTYDIILLDAYTKTRYGSSIPPHLATKEFFELARDHMSTNGVLAYNVIGQLHGWRADIIGAIYRTMKEVFPQVYLFPARTSMNVVLVGTRSAEPYDAERVQQVGMELARKGVLTLPTISTRLRAFSNVAPRAARSSPVLTDDRAPVESLARESNR